MRQVTLAVTMLAATLFPAFSHSPLLSTNPSDGAAISSLQNSIEFSFGQATRVTKVVLIKPDGGRDRLMISVRDFTESLTLNADLSAQGSYEVQWRALSKDGHAIKGAFGFKVK